MRTNSLPRSGQFWAIAATLLILVVAGVSYADVNGTLVAAKPATLRASRLPKSHSMAALEEAVFAEINAIRKKAGLEPVTFAEDLQIIAKQHSSYMARVNRLTHSDAMGRSAGDRLDAFGINWLRYGENVALVQGYSDPCRTVVQAWLRSPGHAANILNPAVTESAVGVAVATDGTLYLTQVFVTRSTH